MLIFIHSGLLLAYFWTSWADQCKQMTQVVHELAKELPQVLYVLVSVIRSHSLHYTSKEKYLLRAILSFCCV